MKFHSGSSGSSATVLARVAAIDAARIRAMTGRCRSCLLFCAMSLSLSLSLCPPFSKLQMDPFSLVPSFALSRSVTSQQMVPEPWECHPFIAFVHAIYGRGA